MASTNLSQPIYRYKFNEDFMTELYNFSKIHQYDDRKEFKSAWNVWAEENAELINISYDQKETFEYSLAHPSKWDYFL